MKIAVMQPYFFPYIGYFQLMNAVDLFVIYDDVNYMKQGWINRNRILLNGQPHYITIGLADASSFKKINEINVSFDSSKLLKTIYQAYRKAIYISEVYQLIEMVVSLEENNLAKFVSNSIIGIAKYIGIEKKFINSSRNGIGIELKGQERILDICKFSNATHYYNAIGGQNLYDKNEFYKNGVELKFIKTNEIYYKQFNNNFVPSLSIIDVMMFNSKDEIKKMLNKYELI